MVEKAEESSATATDPVMRSCWGNRYCSFSGPFYSQRLLLVGKGRPQFVGRCYSDGCGAFVCSRCAHRRPPDRPLTGLSTPAWVLCCPFDGEPLGRGDEWQVVSGKGEVIDRVRGPLEAHTFDEARLLGSRRQASLENAAMALGLLARGFELLEDGEYEQAIEVTEQVFSFYPEHPLAYLLRFKCGERNGDHGFAWQALRALLRLDSGPFAAVTHEIDLLQQAKASQGQQDESDGTELLPYRDELLALAGRRRLEVPERPKPELSPELAEALRLSATGQAEATVACLTKLAARASVSEIVDPDLLNQWLALEYAKLERTQEAMSCLDKALVEARASEQPARERLVLTSRVVLLLKDGKQAEASPIFEQLLPMIVEGGGLELAMPILCCGVQLTLLRNEVDKAVQLLEQMEQRPHDPMGQAITALCRLQVVRRQSGEADTEISPDVLDQLGPEMKQIIEVLADPRLQGVMDPESFLGTYCIGFLEGKVLGLISQGPRPAAGGPAARSLPLGLWASWEEREEEVPRPQADTPSPEIDRLLDPRYGGIVAFSRGSKTRPTLIVIGHEYVIPEQQRNVYLQLEHILAQEAGIPILMEGFEGPQKRRATAAIRNRARRSERALALLAEKGRLAADVLARHHPADGLFFGVDSAEHRAAQKERGEKILSVVRSSIPPQAAGNITPETFAPSCFDVFAALLKNLRQQLPAGPLEELLAMREDIEGQDGIMAAVNKLVALARQTDLALDPWPSVEALYRAARMEKKIDFREVEKERQILIGALGNHASLPLSGARSRAVARWLEEGSPEEDTLPVPQVGTSKPKSWWRRLLPFGSREEKSAFPEWFERLATISVASGQGGVSQSRYYERLGGLLDALGVKLPDSGILQKYIEYVHLADSIDRNRLPIEDLPSLTEALVDRFVTSGTEHGIVFLHRRLDELRKFLELGLPAARVRSLIAEDPSVVGWVTDLAHLGEYLLDKGRIDDDPSLKQYRQLAAVCAPILEKVLPYARDYYFHACSRSVAMAKRALAWQAERPSVAVLICGRFHLDNVLRVLRSNAKVSWALALPSRKGEQAKAKRHTWGWLAREEEVVPV